MASHPSSFVQLELHQARLFSKQHLLGLRQLFGATMVVSGFFIGLNILLAGATFGRVMPFTRIAGSSYGWQDSATARERLADNHNNANLALSVEGQSILLNANQAGVRLQLDDTLAQTHSGWRQIPIIGLVSNLLFSYQPVYSIDQVQLASSLKSVIPEMKLEPKEAKVIIPLDLDQGVEVVPASGGKVLDAQVAAAQVAFQAKDNVFALRILPNALEPKWKTEDYAAFLPQLESARKTSLTIKAGDQEIVINGADLQKLLAVDTDGIRLAVMIDQVALTTYIKSRMPQFYQTPISTKVSLRDGVEVSRQDGVAGKTLDAEKTAQLVAESYKQGVMIGEAVFAVVDPNILYSRSYTNNDQELYKLIENFAASHKGSYRVAAVELEGPGHRSSFYNADDAIITASTYKVFVAYAALLKVESGEWTLNSSTSLGSLDKCMTNMIVVSDNSCALAIQDKLGWKWLDSFLNDKGFKATKLNNSMGGDKYSTARDEMALLTGLYNTELVNQTSRDYLFGLMGKQIYTQGIVAGSGGSLVADKVGFLDDLYHDMGIVYGPKATYALVIMTEGAGGFQNIRLLSQQIYDYYNR